MAKDYYDLLGVSKSASADDIKSSYRKLARKYHPDVNKEKGAQQKFTEVQHAYDILSDDGKRKLYDQFGAAAFESGGPGTAAGQQPRGSRGAPGQGHYSWSNVGGSPGAGGFGADFEMDDAGSVFDAIFGGRGGSPFGGGGGGGGRRAKARSRAGDDDEAGTARSEITVDFLTAARGGTQRLRVGEGSKAKTIDVTIAAGTEDGAQLRVRNGTADGRDLILKVKVSPHELFRRGEGPDTGKGLDLTLDLPLTIAEATLGATVSVPTLSAPVETQVPPGTASGKKLRLRAKGIHDPQGRHGDLYAVIRIVPPKGDALTPQQRETLEDIAAVQPNPRSGAAWSGRL